MPQTRNVAVTKEEIPRKDRPEQTEYNAWLGKLAERFEAKEQYLIPVLQFVQGEIGYLSPEAMRAAARYLRIPESKVYGVASFYAQFYFHPRGRNTLTICRGTACHVRGSGRLLRELENFLQVKPGHATDDMTFSLDTVACFGACALAPVVVVNDQVHRQQTPASLKNMVQQIRTQTLKKSGSVKKTATASRNKPKPRKSNQGKAIGRSAGRTSRTRKAR